MTTPWACWWYRSWGLCMRWEWRKSFPCPWRNKKSRVKWSQDSSWHVPIQKWGIPTLHFHKHLSFISLTSCNIAFYLFHKTAKFVYSGRTFNHIQDLVIIKTHVIQCIVCKIVVEIILCRYITPWKWCRGSPSIVYVILITTTKWSVMSQSHKSYNAPTLHTTIHRTQWCTAEYGTCAYICRTAKVVYSSTQ